MLFSRRGKTRDLSLNRMLHLALRRVVGRVRPFFDVLRRPAQQGLWRILECCDVIFDVPPISLTPILVSCSLPY